MALIFRYFLAVLLAISFCRDAVATTITPFVGYTFTYSNAQNFAIPAVYWRDWVVCDFSQGCGNDTHYPRSSNCDPAVQNPGWVAWTNIEPTKGTFDFSAFDATVPNAVSKGLRPMHVFFGMNPRWATGLSGTNACAGYPTNLGDADIYIRTMTAHALSKGVHDYECWNEANQTIFYGGTIQQLVAICQHVYQIVKSIDPTATVSSPSFTGITSIYYIQKYLDAGGGQWMDALNFHPYPFYTSGSTISYPEQMALIMGQLKIELANAGIPNVPIWNTEFDTAPANVPYTAVSYILGGLLGGARMLWYSADLCLATNTTDGGCLEGPGGGLNNSGIAARTICAWLCNATYTTPPARQALTNQVSISGGTAHVGCTPGTNSGSLPTGVTLFNPDTGRGIGTNIAGVGTLNGHPYFDFQVCGTPTSGATSTTVFIGPKFPASTGQWVTTAANVQLIEGSLSGFIQANNLGPSIAFSVYNAGGGTVAATRGQTYIYPVANVDFSVQSYTSFTFQIADATVTQAGMWFQTPYVVGTPVDGTFRIYFPQADLGTQWLFDFTRQDGTSGELAWDVSGTLAAPVVYSSPAKFTYQQALDGGVIETPIISQTVYQTNVPTLLETHSQAIGPL